MKTARILMTAVLFAIFSLTLTSGAFAENRSDVQALAERIVELSEDLAWEERRKNDLLHLLKALNATGGINRTVDLHDSPMEIGDTIAYNQGDWTGDPKEEAIIMQTGLLVRMEERPGMDTMYGIYNLEKDYLFYKSGSPVYYKKGMPLKKRREISFNW